MMTDTNIDLVALVEEECIVRQRSLRTTHDEFTRIANPMVTYHKVKIFLDLTERSMFSRGWFYITDDEIAIYHMLFT